MTVRQRADHASPGDVRVLPRPNFFIVGAAKCGTTSLYAALAQHPDVFMPTLKEPHFFGEDLERLNHKRFTLDQYLALFARVNGERRIGEASTSYLVSHTAANEIHSFAPDARIVAMVRNPIDQMYSYHANHVAGGGESIFDFADALAAESDRKLGGKLPCNKPEIRQLLCYREVATFSPQLLRFLDVFGREAVKVIMFDDWVSDPASVYRDTASFLGIDPHYTPRIAVKNPSRRVRSPMVHRLVHEPPPSVQAIARALLPQSRRARLTYRLSRANTRVAPRPSMHTELRGALVDEFAPEIERLGHILGRDLSPWLRVDSA